MDGSEEGGFSGSDGSEEEGGSSGVEVSEEEDGPSEETGGGSEEAYRGIRG